MSVTFITPVLETERLILRGPQAADWPHWRAFAETERSRFIGGPFDLRAAWRTFGHVIGHWVLRGYGSFVITTKGSDVPFGMTGPWHPADWPEPEIGWTLWSEAHEGKGLAFEAAAAARDFAYRVLGWRTAVSYIDHGNDRSVALAERLGARLDPDAPQPSGDRPCQVYRHPAPEFRP